MLTLRLMHTLADAIKRYIQQHLDHPIQHVTALNAASILLGYQHHRQARAELIAGDEPMMTAPRHGQTFLARTASVLTHFHQQHGRPAASPIEITHFARTMIIAHDASLLMLVDPDNHLSKFLSSGVSTIVADSRPWLTTALQRAITQELGHTYGAGFGVIDSDGFYSAGLPSTHPLPSGRQFHFKPTTPNIFYRARVDHATERLALPIITPAVRAEYDTYMMRMCHSVHAVYLCPTQHAVSEWQALCGPHPLKHGFVVVGVTGSQLTVDHSPLIA